MDQERHCIVCNAVIPAERIEILPNTVHCIKCVDKHGPKKVYDPNAICARASQSSQNGFAPSD